MSKRRVSQSEFEKAIAFLRDPSGDGSMRTSMRKMGEKVFRCLTCGLPTAEQDEPTVDVTSACRCEEKRAAGAKK
jgi:hypothetical protein